MDMKPKPQSLAMAYAIKRRMAQKMAEGGMVRETSPGMEMNGPQSNSDLMNHESMSTLPPSPPPAQKPAADSSNGSGNMMSGLLQGAGKGLGGSGTGFAEGGMIGQIMKKRMGKPDMHEEDMHGDSFLTAEMPPTEMGTETYPTGDTEHEINPRKQMVSGIMAKLRSRHFGR